MVSALMHNPVIQLKFFEIKGYYKVQKWLISIYLFKKHDVSSWRVEKNKN